MNKRRGLNLVELMVVLGLISMMGGLAVLNLRRAPTSASNKSVAELLGAELRRARAEALRQRSPVALALPSQSGTRPAAPGVYWLEGSERARITRRLDLTREHPGACIFAGFWDLNSALLQDPLASNANDVPQGAQRDDRFNPLNWNLPDPQDGALIFGPSGMATSNGLVHFDGAFHLVVAGGVRATSSSFAGIVARPLTYFKADGFIDPYTVSVSFQGDVQVRKGVTAAASVADAGTADRSDLPGLPAAGANQDPVVQLSDVEVLPPTPAGSLPPGVMALVPKEHYLTIKLAATDPDGDALRVRWTCDNGSFSTASNQLLPMEWSPERQRWETLVQWRPPSTAAVGAVFNLNADVVDARGATTTIGGDVVAALKVQTAREGTIVIGHRYTSVLHLCSPDGSGLRELPMPDTVCSLAAAPDGARLVVSYWGGGAYYGTIGATNLDATNQRILVSLGYQVCEPDISSNGRLAYHTADGIHVIDGDGNPASDVHLVVGTDCYYPRWSPDGDWIAYASLGDVFKVRSDGSGTPISLGAGYSPSWSPDGTRLLIKRTDGLWVINADETNLNPQHIISGCIPSSDGNCCCWSPDGTQIAYICGSQDVCIADADGSNQKLLHTMPQADAVLWLR